jgi:hypothetical protein
MYLLKCFISKLKETIVVRIKLFVAARIQIFRARISIRTYIHVTKIDIYIYGILLKL